MNLTPADKALAAGFAGDPQHYELEPRFFDVTGIGADGRAHDICIEAPDGFAAGNVGIAYGWSAVSARLHPRELTYEQGHARYPKALRLDCFVDAWRGWIDAQTEARAERLARGQRDDSDAILRSYDWALVAQMSRPDPLEQAHRAMQGAEHG